MSAEILARLDAIEDKIDQLLGAAGGVVLATDADLDNQYGDPVVKFAPRDWKGQDYKGCNYSTTEPAFLQVLADALVFFAGRADDPKKKQWNLRDAGRALAWKKRLENGWKSPNAKRTTVDTWDDNNEPF